MTQLRPVRVLHPRPSGMPGAAALDDLALITAEGLGDLGHAVERTTSGVDAGADVLTILIGGHLMEGRGIDALPPDVVIYNALPVPPGGLAGRYPEYARLLARNPVWDVSRSSRDAIVGAFRRNADAARHVPAGWVPALARLPAVRAQDIGVLFIGPMTRERWRLMAEFEAHGLEMRAVAEVHGKKRDALVARARMVLELAPLEEQTPEPTRLVYLLANRKVVLAETTPDLEADADLRAALRLAPFGELARACQRLANDVDGRQALQQRGLDAVRRRDAASVLKRAMEGLPRTPRAVPAGSAVAAPVTTPGPFGHASTPAPTVLNLNGDRDPVEEAINLALPGAAAPVGAAPPDIVADPCDPALPGREFDTDRFGPVALSPGAFTRILAPWVPARVPDLIGFMTTCLSLLAEGGTLEILVPYDLSHGAWADPANRRAFNEHAFTAFTDGHDAIGWTEARFDLDSLEFAFSPLGERLEVEGTALETLLAAPRAVEAMRVVLRKRTLE